jgi:hypothetical protein
MTASVVEKPGKPCMVPGSGYCNAIGANGYIFFHPPHKIGVVFKQLSMVILIGAFWMILKYEMTLRSKKDHLS